MSNIKSFDDFGYFIGPELTRLISEGREAVDQVLGELRAAHDFLNDEKPQIGEAMNTIKAAIVDAEQIERLMK